MNSWCMPVETPLRFRLKSRVYSLIHCRLLGLVKRTMDYSSRGAFLSDKIKLALLSLALPIRRIPLFRNFIPRLQEAVMSRVIVGIGESYFKLADPDSFDIFTPGWEQWMWKYLRLSGNAIFIDVGAHIGYYTVRLAKRLKRGLIVALEPNPWTFKVLLENIRLNRLRNVIPLQIAAWSEEAVLPLLATKHSSGSGLVVKMDEGVYVNVRARRLDDVVRELGLERVDFVKIDVEGAEPEVLKGMHWILEYFKPRLIVEVWHMNYEKVAEYLENLGYTITTIPESVGKYNQYIYAYPLEKKY